MKRLSEYEGEEALDILADLIVPAADIFSDKRIAALYRAGKRAECIKIAIREHKQAVIELLAVLEREDPKTYKPKIMTLPLQLLQVLNDPEVVGLFRSQAQETESASFGSATENTEATEEA